MTQIIQNVPIPLLDPIASPVRKEYLSRKDGKRDPLENTLTVPWVQFFSQQSLQINAAPYRANFVALTSQVASIGTTDMSGGALSPGVYRLSYYTRIKQAASVSSSLTITLSWTDGGVLQSFSAAAITGNTTATDQSNVLLIRVDNVSPVNYATAYVSVGGTPMLYNLDAILEIVKT
jgi:hypothetical protein